MPTDDRSVAVVIPVYNGEKYLEETLKSVLRQTLQPSEIVVINDGSTDRSLEIARGFEPGVRVLSRLNRGVCATRNFGASITSASWLAFLDHDDVWEPNFLARMTALMADVPDATFVYADRRILSEDPDTGAFALSDPQSMPKPEMLSTHLQDRCPFTPCSALIHRQAFFAAGGFDVRHNGVEDWDLWLRLTFQKVRFAQCCEPLVQYRVHSANASRHALRMLAVSFRVLDRNLGPRMKPFERMMKLSKVKSRLEAEAAILMRENATPGSLSMMLRSIMRHPLHERRRYPIALHMLLSRTKAVPLLLTDRERVRSSLAVLSGEVLTQYQELKDSGEHVVQH